MPVAASPIAIAVSAYSHFAREIAFFQRPSVIDCTVDLPQLQLTSCCYLLPVSIDFKFVRTNITNFKLTFYIRFAVA